LILEQNYRSLYEMLQEKMSVQQVTVSLRPAQAACLGQPWPILREV
jgi:hypothetical protein